MLYQHPLSGERPYLVSVSSMPAFLEHRHSEIEFSYCLEGAYDICIDKKKYHLEAGDLALIGSMTVHEIPESGDMQRLGLTLEAGPVMLGEYFAPVSRLTFVHPILHLSAHPGMQAVLQPLFWEIARLRQAPEDFSELIIRGNLYKILGYILSHFAQESSGHERKEIRDLSKIDQALELIRTRYMEALSVDDVADMTGYGKSNFCRIFRNVTGKTFHALLNECRVENAKMLLCNTDYSIENIAQQAGFPDAKTFCRVFKNFCGVSPGAYRKHAEKPL